MTRKITHAVYSITNTVNGKKYIGSAVDVTRRLWVHKSAMKTGTHKNIKISRAVKKHGIDVFRFDVIEVVPKKEDLISREQHWIDTLRAVTLGYNIAPNAYSSLGRKATPVTRAKLSKRKKGVKLTAEQRAARAGRVCSEETRKKISASLKVRLVGRSWSASRRAAYKPKYGPRLSVEAKEKLRVLFTNRIVSEETRQKMSASAKLRVASAETRAKLSAIRMGHPVSEETRKKISDAKRARYAAITTTPEVRA